MTYIDMIVVEATLISQVKNTLFLWIDIMYMDALWMLTILMIYIDMILVAAA
jgi:hypothetical protein